MNPGIKRGRTLSKQKGFTLLEAIVAITLFATSGVAIYGLINNNLTSLNRVNDVLLQQQLVGNLLEDLKTINPMEQSSGEAELQGLVANWTATPLEQPVQNNAGGGLGNFMLTLYQVDIFITRGSRKVADYSTRIVGQKKLNRVQGQ